MNFNPLFMIISCQKESKLWKSISKQFIGFNHVILSGGYNFSDYFFEKNILHLNCNDFYDGLPEKVLGGLLVIQKEDKFKSISHIIKMDSNNSIPKNGIQEVFLQIKSLQEYDYFGQKLMIDNGQRNRKYHFKKVKKISKWHNKEYLGDYCDWLHGGHSYCLSKKSLRIIENEFNLDNYKSSSDKYIFEDVMIALLLKKNKIFPFEYNLGIIPEKENFVFLRKFKGKIKRFLRFVKNILNKLKF